MKAYIIEQGIVVGIIDAGYIPAEQYAIDQQRYTRGQTVLIAGAVTDSGQPVNVRAAKYSTAKRWERAAQHAEHATRREHNGVVFYTLN